MGFEPFYHIVLICSSVDEYGNLIFANSRLLTYLLTTAIKGPSIYDVHTEWGEGIGLRWTHVDGGGGSSSMWTSTQKIKIRVH